MATERVDTLIIGGGLSGIYAAYLLAQKGLAAVVLEARAHAGGRILSPDLQGYFCDLGPSWYWPSVNPKMSHLIQALGLEGYRQFDRGKGCFERSNGEVKTVSGYATEPQSWRISGGMIALITTLCEVMGENAIRYHHPVSQMEKLSEGEGVLVSVGELEREPWTQLRTEKVILALPPRLAAASILFEPELSHGLTQAMLKIGTWMAGQAKFCALYAEPFWRQAGLSGQAFSERGPLVEIHDASSNSQVFYGLTGFAGLPAVQRHQPERLRQAMLAQLATLYGEAALHPMAFFYQDWARERFTATALDQAPMYTHPVYQPPEGRTSIWDGAVHFAGTETATDHGGYLEGALGAAERAVKNILA